jgi:hypothetical protein
VFVGAAKKADSEVEMADGDKHDKDDKGCGPVDAILHELKILKKGVELDEGYEIKGVRRKTGAKLVLVLGLRKTKVRRRPKRKK